MSDTTRTLIGRIINPDRVHAVGSKTPSGIESKPVSELLSNVIAPRWARSRAEPPQAVVQRDPVPGVNPIIRDAEVASVGLPVPS